MLGSESLRRRSGERQELVSEQVQAASEAVPSLHPPVPVL